MTSDKINRNVVSKLQVLIAREQTPTHPCPLVDSSKDEESLTKNSLSKLSFLGLLFSVLFRK